MKRLNVCGILSGMNWRLFCLVAFLVFVSGCALREQKECASQKGGMQGRSSCAAELVWVADQHPMSDKEVERLRRCDSLLIMIPGISTGNISKRCAFLNQILTAGFYGQAVLYDWEAGSLSRKIMLPSATQRAAERLVEICSAFRRNGEGRKKNIDLLAHSAGTVVVTKVASEIVRTRSRVRFRHVLFLGTPVAVDEPLEDLKKTCASVLNVHSAFDKVNRNINDRLGVLTELNSKAYQNLRMDHSIGGRIIRHNTFLLSNPENWINYSTYLSHGFWPKADVAKISNDCDVMDFHRYAMGVMNHSDKPHAQTMALLPQWLTHSSYERKYYGVIIAGLLRCRQFAPLMKDMLRDKQVPVYLRMEIYQALGNIKDGRHIYFLKESRGRDPVCSDVIRDVLRSLKQKRIQPKRFR